MEKLLRWIPITVVLIFLALGDVATAQRPTVGEVRTNGPNLERLMAAKAFSAGSITMPYRELELTFDSSQSHALVIYLHGKSASGSDNVSQLQGIGLHDTISYLQSARINAVVLAPQAAPEHEWGSAQMSAAVKGLIDTYVAGQRVDPNRIYILGDSAGGGGVWRMVADYPGLFAAAMAVAATPRASVEALSRTPVIAVVGERDPIAPVSRVRPVINQMRALGADVRLVVLPDRNHVETCDTAFTPDNLAWVFAHAGGSASMSPNGLGSQRVPSSGVRAG